jgi:hypothetical protein
LHQEFFHCIRERFGPLDIAYVTGAGDLDKLRAVQLVVHFPHCRSERAMSALGRSAIAMSALLPKADMCGAIGHVRFGPIADSCSAAKLNFYSINSSAR